MIKFEDFRIISDHISHGEDLELYQFLTKDICGNYFDKFVKLLNLRIRYIEESIKLSTPDSSTVDIHLDVFKNNFIKQCVNTSEIITVDKFIIKLDLPEEFYHTTYDAVLLDSVKFIIYDGNELPFKNLSTVDEITVFERLPLKIIQQIQNYCNKPILLMDSKFGMDKIEINIFDNSGFEWVKMLYNYYTPLDILETVFFLSKRFTDISYINSRTPKEINHIIKLYSEEVAKPN